MAAIAAILKIIFERKTTIRNRYNYLPAPQSKHYKQRDKRTVSSQKMAKRLSKKGRHAKTHNNRYSKLQQQHRLGTVSKILRGGGGGGGGGRGVGLEGAEIDFKWPQLSPIVLPWYTQDVSLVRVKGS